VEGLKTSSCGDGFVEALSCFMRAEEHERGSKCVEQFVALHACMVANADEFEEFTKELVENEEKEGYRAKASASA
jgi:intermembrane space import and assembly protein 40